MDYLNHAKQKDVTITNCWRHHDEIWHVISCIEAIRHTHSRFPWLSITSSHHFLGFIVILGRYLCRTIFHGNSGFGASPLYAWCSNERADLLAWFYAQEGIQKLYLSKSEMESTEVEMQGFLFHSAAHTSYRFWPIFDILHIEKSVLPLGGRSYHMCKVLES